MIRTSSPLLQFGFNQIVFLMVTVTRAWPDLSLVPKMYFKRWAFGSNLWKDHINSIKRRSSPGRHSTPELRTSGLMSWASLWTGWDFWGMGSSAEGTAEGCSLWVLADRWEAMLSSSWLDAGIKKKDNFNKQTGAREYTQTPKMLTQKPIACQFKMTIVNLQPVLL